MSKRSPWFSFGVFSAATILLFGGVWITRSAETPPWREGNRSDSATIATEVPKPGVARTDGQLTPFRFLSYNVKNWLNSTQNPEKSSEAKSAIIRIISTSSPDVVGLCEIGSQSDVSEIQAMLKKAGLNLPHTHHTGGIDSVRHLAILSRFPIVSTEKPGSEIPGGKLSMQRGILDATIQIGDRPVRFIGLHLKSKRVVTDFDQALLRLTEAQHVRRHIDGILKSTPSALLVAYGDFNDHIRSPSTRALVGTYRTPLYLSPVHVADNRGEKWTYNFASQNSYSRIDFVTLSDSMKSHLDRKNSRIVDDENWETASDHRAILVAFD